MLVGQGAWEYARSKGIANPRNFLPFQGPMVTKKSIERHNKYSTHAFSHNNIQEDGDSSTKIYDTVGAIALDNEGNVAAAVSTGGVVLKHSGRVGDSAIPGSGFWAESSNLEDHNSNLSLACSTTGELLIVPYSIYI